MQQRTKFDSPVLGNRPFQAGYAPLLRLGVADDPQYPHDLQRVVTDWDGVASQGVLGHERQREGGDSVELFELLDRLADVFLAKRFQVERIVTLEHRLQRPLQPGGRFGRSGHRSHNFRQFGNRGHPHFVPVEVHLLHAGKGLIRHLKRGELQTTRIKQMLQHRPFGHGRRLVVLLEHFVRFR